MGLSATVTRKNGQHPIAFMHPGNIRSRVDPRMQAEERSLDHRVIVEKTAFRLEAGSKKRVVAPSLPMEKTPPEYSRGFITHKFASMGVLVFL
jgi:hypothetical protein